MQDKITCKDPQKAFEDAIKAGRLSMRVTDWNYAAHFMYMFTDADGVDQFKHKLTRRYLVREDQMKTELQERIEHNKKKYTVENWRNWL